MRVALAALVQGSALGYEARVATTPRPAAPPSAVARYIDGVRQTDRAEIWASMSPDYQAQARRKGDQSIVRQYQYIERYRVIIRS